MLTCIKQKCPSSTCICAFGRCSSSDPIERTQPFPPKQAPTHLLAHNIQPPHNLRTNSPPPHLKPPPPLLHPRRSKRPQPHHIIPIPNPKPRRPILPIPLHPRPQPLHRRRHNPPRQLMIPRIDRIPAPPRRLVRVLEHPGLDDPVPVRADVGLRGREGGG